MSDFENEEVLVQDELASLKDRAKLMGLTFHPSISAEKLREKIAKALEGEAPAEDAAAAPAVAAKAEAKSAEESPAQKRVRLKQEALKLVRIRVTCMNPAKAEWEGEIFTAGNTAIGSVKKFVPFNADEGWHVPYVIYQQLQQRQCQIFVTTKTKNGVAVRKGKLIKEFAIEVLPELTKEELEELARRQAMAKSVD